MFIKILRGSFLVVVNLIFGRAILAAINSAGYHPEFWLEQVIVDIAPKFISDETIWIIVGILALLFYVFELKLRVLERIAEFFDKKNIKPATSFSVKLDQQLTRMGGYEYVCAMIVKNLESNNLKNSCSVQIEQISGFDSDGMRLPFVLRTEGQIERNDNGRFNLSSKQMKKVPVLYRKQRRINEWFLLSENKTSYFIPVGNIKMVIGIYGGEVNCKALVTVRVEAGFNAQATIREVSDDYLLPVPSSEQYLPLSEASLIVYENTEGSLAAGMAEANIGNLKAEPLSWYATAIANLDGIIVYGIKPPLRTRREIDSSEFKGGSISNNGSSLSQFGKDEPVYVDLAIKKADINQCIKEISGWG